MTTHPDLAKASAILGMAAAATVLGLNVLAGWIYRNDCLKAGGEIGGCWDRGLSISGLGSGGPLAAAFGIGGYVLGASKGRKEGREEGYAEGYWTLNPDLHPDNPDA